LPVTGGDGQQRLSAKLPKAFQEERGRMFSRGGQNMCKRLSLKKLAYTFPGRLRTFP